MRINLIRPAIILLTVAMTVFTVSCNQSSNEPNVITPMLGENQRAGGGPVVRSVTVTAGKATSIDFVFETNKSSPGKLSLVVFNIGKPFQGGRPPELPMPTGLNVSIKPQELMAYPNHTYHQTISINTSAELPPGIYWLVWRSTFESENGGEGTGAITVTVEPTQAPAPGL